MPLRAMLDLPGGDNLFGWMPGSMAEPEVFGTKLASVFPGNFELGMHSHHGVVVLFEKEHGRRFAVVDASEITAIRAAVASALATKFLKLPGPAGNFCVGRTYYVILLPNPS